MTRSGLRGLMGCAVVALAAGCGGGGGNGGNGDGGTISADQFPTALTQAFCDAYKKCGNVAPYFCQISFTGGSGGLPDFNKAIAAGRVKYDGSHAQACLDAVAAQFCDPAAAKGQGEPADCRAALSGTVMAGGDCYNDIDCVGGTCDTSNSGCPGKCLSYLAAGADCTMGNAQCDDSHGYRCIGGKCAQPVASGAPCTTSSDCSGTLACINQVCATPGSAGATCQSNGDCATGFYCLRGAMTGTCTAQVAKGGACAEDAAHLNSVTSECERGTVCAGASYDPATKKLVSGTCAAPSDEGGACAVIPVGAQGFSGCLLGLVCASGQCAKPPSSGACASDPVAQCLPGTATCDATTKTCQPLHGTDGTCTRDADCASGSCNNGKCAADTTCHEK